MTVYPLAPLSRVRQLREESAATEYAAREKIVLAARQETQARRKTLKEYVAWREEEEDRRYREILGQELSRKEMDAFKAGVANLQEKENVLTEAVEEALKAEEEAARYRDESAQILKLCRKDTRKIDEHWEIWRVGEARELDRLENLEMEEFTGAQKPEMEEDSYD